MTIFVVEKDRANMKTISDMIRALQPEDDLFCFHGSPEALAAARQQEVVDVAFLDIDLPEMDGLLLGQYLKDLHPFVNLIYLTDDRGDAFDAMLLRSSGCLLFPLSSECVGTELKELRYSARFKTRSRVFAQTFGNFEFFVDGVPVAFKYTKTKEILAVLINSRGAHTTNGEIIAALWEDDGDPEKKASYLSNLRQDLMNTLTRLDLKSIILKQRGSMAIAANCIECDLFEWLDKKKKSRYQYIGEYMNQYSWAEYTHASLDELSYAMEE